MRYSTLLRLKIVRITCLLCAFATFVGVGARTAAAQNTAASEATTADVMEGEEPAEEDKMRPTLDLGSFKIKDLRPTRNETAKVTFSIHLAFNNKVTNKQVAQLEQWKHRLRDQVITAVRITYIKDFHEPDLSQLRRQILIRVNRLFKHRIAEDVLVTEYRFRTN